MLSPKQRNFMSTDWYKSVLSHTRCLIFKVNSGNTRTICEIRLKLTIEAPEQCYWRRSHVFIVKLEQILYIVLVFPTFSLNKYCRLSSFNKKKLKMLEIMLFESLIRVITLNVLLFYASCMSLETYYAKTKKKRKRDL